MRRLCSIFLLFLVALAAGCETGSTRKADESLTDEKRPGPTFFEEIPADTFYVYTGLEPYPEQLVREMLADEGESPWGGLADRLTADGTAAPEPLVAIAEELEGKTDPEGLRELGLTLDAHYALYGLGPVPVFRLELGDEKAFRETLDRIESKTDTDVERHEQKGTAYRVYQADEQVVPVVVRDGALVVSAMKPSVTEAALPYLLGHETPDESLAETGAIRRLADTYGYESFSLGYLDILGAVRAVSGGREIGPVTEAAFQAGGVDTDRYSETCREEIVGLVETVPRLVFGLQELSSETAQLHGGLEMETDLGGQLADAAEPIPGLEADLFDEAALSIGFGLDVERAADALKRRAEQLVEEPYECDRFEQINEWARRYEQRPVPPSLAQMRGATLMLQGLEFDDGQYVPTEVEAVALVRSSNPQGLIGRLQAVVPGLMQTDLQADGVPVALQQLGRQVGALTSPHIAMTDELVAFSTGVGMQDEMAVLLEGASSGAGTSALAVGWSLEPLYESLPQRGRDLLARMVGGESLEEMMAGSRRTEVQLTGGGIFFETRTVGGSSSTSPDDGDESTETSGR